MTMIQNTKYCKMIFTDIHNAYFAERFLKIILQGYHD